MKKGQERARMKGGQEGRNAKKEGRKGNNEGRARMKEGQEGRNDKKEGRTRRRK